MANRNFRRDTEVWRAVQAVGGPKWAAAYCDVHQESVNGWLERGLVPTARYAILLAEEAMRRGIRVSLRLLAGMDADPAKPPSEPRMKRRGRDSNPRLDSPQEGSAVSSLSGSVQSIHQFAVSSAEADVPLGGHHTFVSRQVAQGPAVYAIVGEPGNEAMPEAVDAARRYAGRYAGAVHDPSDMSPTPRATRRSVEYPRRPTHIKTAQAA